ncbi:PCRF domain-containing protein, partial [Marinobacter sp.]|uniref:PCRF domain-containing protein n=1 Tax=Marinobacter sp. TaxID=50741 RepID=UPI0034A12A59
MKPSIQNRLEQLSDRFEEVSGLLSDASIIANQDQFRDLSREFADIEPVVHCFQAWKASLADIEAARELAHDGDADMREMAEEELALAEQKTDELDEELQRLMLPKDPNDGKNVFLEIRAGAGGDEAAIFAGDLFIMYLRYAERRRWQVEVINE